MSEEGAHELRDLVNDILESPKEKPKKKIKAKGMLLGERRDNGDIIQIDKMVLARHAAMLGSTGSGKTVMAKTVIEEAALAGIPALILDPQGDLARLALAIDENDLEDHDGEVSRMKKLISTMEVRIWTPLRSKGLPLCIDPFRSPPADLDPEEAITAWDMVAAGFSSLAGFDVEKTQGKVVKPFLYEILVNGTRLGLDVSDFRGLAKVVREPQENFTRALYPEAFIDLDDDEEKPEIPPWEEIMFEHGLRDYDEMLPKSTRNDLARRLSAFSSGVNQLLFSNGVPIDIDSFCEPAMPGKVPLNIVYLNTIQDEAQKQYFVQELARELYDWMLTQQPAEGELKLLFFMDEVAPYLPPHPRNPPAKDLIKLIFKQARKYGVACVLATQNVSDVDYKILAQANTTFIGRFTQPQDVEKVRHLLKESGGDQDLVKQLPTLGPGQFQMVAPDVDPNPVPIQCRWLYTDHGAPLNEDQVEDVTTAEIRAWAKARSAGKGRSRGKGAAAAAARGSTWSKGGEESEGIVESARLRSVGGMTAAAQGIVDDSAFEVRLMGGLSVLKDGRDPLYVMQATVNASTSLVMAWTLVALLLAWRDTTLEWWWLAGSFILTLSVGLVISLEMLLSHDAELLRKLSKFARTSQILIVAWLWGLLYWSSNGLDLYGAEPLLEVVVVWVTLFLFIDWWNRFKLGRIRWNGGNALSKLRGLTAVLTDTQLTEMQSNSKQILAGMRWILDFATLGWLCVILIHNPEDNWARPTLWLASLYALTFGSETWLRLRGRMPESSI
ncbi:MAG: ATP-binding protein [Candidatus Thermoplasmatota archaeon]|nr:ATP-binding protein [Candidatus Thermoplasmatota archaeon]